MTDDFESPIRSDSGYTLGDWLLRPFFWYQARHERRYERRVVTH